MRGTSSTSLREVTQRSQDLLRGDDTSLAQVAEDLFGAADAIDSSNQLVRMLSDGGRPAEVKQAVARSLFEGRVSPGALSVILEIVGRRWSEQEDVLDALEQLGVEALLEQAARESMLEQVEEELFQISRVIDESGELTGALDDAREHPEQRAGIVSRLLEGRVHPLTLALARRAVGRRTDVKPARRLLGFAEFASARRRRLLAIVRSARQLTPEQQSRLSSILTRIYGREVQTNFELDEDVVGGLRVQVGDDLYDATVLARLAQARTRLVA
ncbi:F0F1 ATP synthase subunit delta [Brachybacterium halotolerans subsp. kimchii]|uniref:F0F1 ATP synthase subunit delta n=1 Tax=Brachybacterium halotolerans TaxID=2795215 RepID=UPI001E35E3FF|nr:F0F1 ATP synthase subunit delta [Brachybacterium halotolerans]UEJ82878.1 F0F1 ATP synthase subunit delta [Brachybacterium halotolerans subsp. kimchii]